MKTPSCRLCAGGASILVRFTTRGGMPAGPFPAPDASGRRYDRVLNEDILDPFLARWTGDRGDERAAVGPVADCALEACVAAFRAALPDGAAGDRAGLMGALTLTANLQRTITFLAEILARREVPEAEPVQVALSRRWCGFALEPLRRAHGHLGHLRPLSRALGCSAPEVDVRCREALTALREELQRGKWISADDLL